MHLFLETSVQAAILFFLKGRIMHIVSDATNGRSLSAGRQNNGRYR